MSRWMYFFNTDLTEEVLAGRDRDRFLVGEIHPGPLINAAIALRGTAEAEFPTLFQLRRGNRENLDEWQKLSPQETRQIYYEFLKLRAVCKREQFIIGVSGPAIYEAWRDIWDDNEFEQDLDRIQTMLNSTVESYGCILLT
jgi:hypothetical protein